MLLADGYVSSAAGATDICGDFRALGWPAPRALQKFGLEPSRPLGSKDSADEYYYNIDVDGDDIGDPISKSCSASLTPGDPCILTVELSKGGEISFQA
jgi:hypothetical protein